MWILVYLAREWSGKRVKELGKELHRDPSIVSRLSANYAESRSQQGDDRLPRPVSK
jgi:hypothetical protein